MSSRDNVQQYSYVCGRGSDQTTGSILVQFCAQIFEREISVEFVSIKNDSSNFFPFYILIYLARSLNLKTNHTIQKLVNNYTVLMFFLFLNTLNKKR